MSIVKTNGFLEEYHLKCKSGEIIAGLELIMELDKLMIEMNDPKYVYDTTDADKRMHFMENCIRLTKSPFYGLKMTLMLWQKAFISAVYGFKMADTLRDRFKKVLLLIARKNTKSETCSAIETTELILGVDGADIVCSSNDDSQANILYDAIDVMRLMIDPKQKHTWKNQRWIRNKKTNSKIFKLSERTRNKEGRNIDIAVIDEVHEMKTNVIVKSIEQSQSLKENPKLILITTEGFVNDGFLDDELKYARKILNGEKDGVAADRYLPWLYTQDSEAEVWQDERSWVKSNPTLGIVKQVEYLQEQIDKAKESKADRAFVLSKDFNIKQSNSQAWLDDNDFIYNVEEWQLEDFRGQLALAATDLAETTDLVALKVLLMKKGDNRKYIYSKYWIPESKLINSDDKLTGAKYEEWQRKGLLIVVPGNDVDVRVVAEHITKLKKDFGIRTYKTGYDQKFAKDFKKQMDEDGWDHEMVIQNAESLNSAIKLVEADFKDKLINYNNNEIDRWCLRNSSLKLDSYGRCILEKIQGQANRRIDGAVTLVIVYEILRRYRTDFMQNIY